MMSPPGFSKVLMVLVATALLLLASPAAQVVYGQDFDCLERCADAWKRCLDDCKSKGKAHSFCFDRCTVKENKCIAFCISCSYLRTVRD
ncbi:hypothetical protein ACLB2K_034652 [Fragaria x ananassa]